VRPSTSSLVLSILENFIPTIFVTLLEPFWVILNRLLCLLRPFDTLRDGNAKAYKCLEVKYTSLPPQLVFYRAIRSRHFILALVCAIAISTNVLSVSLSGLFNEKPATVAVLANSTLNLQPLINGTLSLINGNTGVTITYTDHFYATMANLTENTSLPPWIDESAFYLPFDLPALATTSEVKSGDTSIQAYQGSTRGFAIAANCTALTSTYSNHMVTLNTSDDGQAVEFFTSHVLDDGRTATCIPYGKVNGINQTISRLYPYPDAPAGFEIMTSMAPIDSLFYDDFCSPLVVAGWTRLGPVVSNNSVDALNATNGRSLDLAMMACSPVLKTAIYNVTVGTDGRILNTKRTSEFSENIGDFLIDRNETILYQQISTVIAPNAPDDFEWHIDSFVSDWTNAVLAEYINDSSLVDPLAPLPNMTYLTPQFNALYQRLSAMVLGLNKSLFITSTTNTTIPISIITTQTRIFMDLLMFKISVVLLSLHFLAAALYYARRPKRFLPRMPTTIASIIAYVSASHALDDFIEKDGERKLDRSQTYGYGHFRGVDGKTHVGIERQSLVIPLETINPAARKRWRWGKGDSAEVKTWI
jgi:hypothetical protein